MTDLHELFDGAEPDSRPPSIDELWARGRQRRSRRRMARVGVPVFVLLAAVVGIFAVSGGRGDTELVAAGNGAAAPVHQRVWVIPTFLNEPLEALDITRETPRPPDGSAAFENPGNPDLGILVFRQAQGVFANSGTPVNINGVDGYVQIEESMLLTDIEWRVGNSWQVFQALGLSDADAIDAAREFQSDGADGLTGLGWRQISEPEPQEIVTIISSDNGVLVFQDDITSGPVFDTAVAESNGFKVYPTAAFAGSLFVTYRGRLVFSYTPAGTAPVIDPTVLADSLNIVTEEQWRAWLDTWSVMGGTPKPSLTGGMAAGPSSAGSSRRIDSVIGEAVGRFCTEEFDCASAPVLYVVSSHIDSNTELGSEVPMDPAVRAAIESALGRPIRWLETSAEVDAAVNESPSPTILTIGTPVFFPHVLEIDIGWSRGQFEGKRVTVRVGLDDQADNTPETPRATSVP